MRPISLVYALSGLLSLGYQVAWFRVFEDHFGSSQLTFAFVLVCFLGGLAAGSLASRPVATWLARVGGLTDALRTYGLVELLVTMAAAATWCLPLLPPWLGGYELVGNVHEPAGTWWLLPLLVSFGCVFVPCLFMGVTFPLLCDGFRDDPRAPAALYAWNTLGAASGVLLGEFVLLPTLGHWQLLNVMLLGNLLLGAACYRGLAGSAPLRQPAVDAAPAPPKSADGSYRVALAALAGLATGAFEADVLRRLQWFDCRTGAALSCISFWAILAIFFASATVRALPRLPRLVVQAAPLLALVWSAAVWRGGYALRSAVQAGDRAAVEAALPSVPGLSQPFVFFDFTYGIGALLLFTGLFVLPPFYLLALQLPFVCNQAQADHRHLGRVYGANAAAFCVGVLWFAVLAPYGNVFYAMRLFLVVLALCAAAMLLLRPGRRTPPLATAGFGGALLLAALLVPADFAPGWFPPGSAAAEHPVRALRSDGRSTTYVVAEPPGDVLWFDSYRMTGANAIAQQYMRLMAHVPLLAHPEPRRALQICFGAGMTASAIAAHRSIERLDIVDLNPQVFATAPEFAAANRNVIADPRLRLIHDDGRRFLAQCFDRYDFITSEPPPPMVAGVARLYSIDYYRAARAALEPGGVMSQWLPIDQLPLPVMRAAIASFVAVFPDSYLFVGADTNYILIGCNGTFALRNLERRFAELPQVRDDLRAYGVLSPRELFLRFTWAPAQLAAEFGNDPVVLDSKNPFSHACHDPTHPSVLGYDPLGLLAALRALPDGPLACEAALARVVQHLGLLKSIVPDFPVGALQRVPEASAAQVALADAPWAAVELHLDAALQQKQQQPQEAARLLQKAVALAPGFVTAARELGLLALQHQQWEPALDAWRKVVAADPQDVEGHAGVVLCLLQLGRTPEALADAQASVRQFPQVAAMHRLLGDAFAASERRAEALGAYHEALRLDPNDAAAKAGRQRLEGR